MHLVILIDLQSCIKLMPMMREWNASLVILSRSSAIRVQTCEISVIQRCSIEG